MTLGDAKETGAVEETDWHVVRTLSDKHEARMQSVRAGETRASIPESLRSPCYRGEYREFFECVWPHGVGPTLPDYYGQLHHFSAKAASGTRSIIARSRSERRRYCRSSRRIAVTPYMEHVCNIVGNALPCDFAEIVSRQCWFELMSMENKRGRCPARSPAPECETRLENG